MEPVLPGLGQSRTQGSSRSLSQTSSSHRGEQLPFPKHQGPHTPLQGEGRIVWEGRCWQQCLISAAGGREIPAGSFPRAGKGTFWHGPSEPCWVPCWHQPHSGNNH